MLVQKYQKRTLFLLLGSLLLLPSCHQSGYKSHSFAKISAVPAYSKSKKGICVSARCLSKAESKLLFDGRGARLWRRKKTIYPIYISIDNCTPNTYELTPGQIGLKLVCPDLVAARLQLHTARRVLSVFALGITGAAVSYCAAAYITLVGIIGGMPSLIKGGYSMLGLTWLLGVGAPFMSFHQRSYSQASNRSIYADIKDKALYNTRILEPGSCSEFLIFVHYKTPYCRFPMILIDRAHMSKLTFEVTIPPLKDGVS